MYTNTHEYTGIGSGVCVSWSDPSFSHLVHVDQWKGNYLDKIKRVKTSCPKLYNQPKHESLNNHSKTVDPCASITYMYVCRLMNRVFLHAKGKQWQNLSKRRLSELNPYFEQIILIFPTQGIVQGIHFSSFLQNTTFESFL